MFRQCFPALARHGGLLIGIETTENLQIIASVSKPERTGVQRMAVIMSEGIPGPVMPIMRPKSTRLARIVVPRAW
jgi:phosphoheptose isomerase